MSTPSFDEVQKGGCIEAKGHRFKVIKVTEGKFGIKVYTISCIPFCCTTPNGLILTGREAQLRDILGLEKIQTDTAWLSK